VWQLLDAEGENNMPYEIDYLEDEQIIILKHTGEATFVDVVERCKKAAELAKKKSATLFFLDCTLMELKSTASELFNLPKLYDEIGVPRESKLALLLAEKSPIAEDILFYETVCQTRGYNVRVFTSYDEAMAWLKK
jgi:hypothetical protein